jgi:hypothetical protein
MVQAKKRQIMGVHVGAKRTRPQPACIPKPHLHPTPPQQQIGEQPPQQQMDEQQIDEQPQQPLQHQQHLDEQPQQPQQPQKPQQPQTDEPSVVINNYLLHLLRLQRMQQQQVEEEANRTRQQPYVNSVERRRAAYINICLGGRMRAVFPDAYDGGLHGDATKDVMQRYGIACSILPNLQASLASSHRTRQADLVALFRQRIEDEWRQIYHSRDALVPTERTPFTEAFLRLMGAVTPDDAAAQQLSYMYAALNLDHDIFARKITRILRCFTSSLARSHASYAASHLRSQDHTHLTLLHILPGGASPH